MHVFPIEARGDSKTNLPSGKLHNESNMTDRRKTMVAKVLVALGCCTIAVMAFLARTALAMKNGGSM